MVVNSVCGCAAANARPGARLSLQNAKNLIIYSRFSQVWTKKLQNRLAIIWFHSLHRRHLWRFSETGNWFICWSAIILKGVRLK